LRAAVHIALTARCEAHSRLVASLKDAERADPGRHKDDEPRRARRSHKEEDDGKESSGSERNDRQSEAGSLARAGRCWESLVQSLAIPRLGQDALGKVVT